MKFSKLIKRSLLCGASLMMIMGLSAGVSSSSVSASHYHHYRLLLTEPTKDDVTNRPVYFSTNSSSKSLYRLGEKMVKSYGYDSDDLLIPTLVHSTSFENGYIHSAKRSNKLVDKYMFDGAKSYVRYHRNRAFKQGWYQGNQLTTIEVAHPSQRRYIIRHSKNTKFDEGLIAGHFFAQTDKIRGVENKARKSMTYNGYFRASKAQLRKIVVGFANGYFHDRIY